MKVKIVSHNKILLDSEAKYLLFKNQEGESGFLENHASTILLGKKGYVKVEYENDKKEFYIYRNAIFKFSNNKASLLTSIATSGKSLQEATENFEKEVSKRKAAMKKENVDFSKLEKELLDNIKKGKAGQV